MKTENTEWEDHGLPAPADVPPRGIDFVRRLVVDGDPRPKHRDPYFEKLRRKAEDEGDPYPYASLREKRRRQAEKDSK